jgi:hypothetical protein
MINLAESARSCKSCGEGRGRETGDGRPKNKSARSPRSAGEKKPADLADCADGVAEA